MVWRWCGTRSAAIAVVVVCFLCSAVESSKQNQLVQLQYNLDEEDRNSPATVDYCNFETFNASCPEGSVVFMVRALYGRMREGRCLKINTSLGCQSDVLRELDARCSGRPSCSIGIPDASLHENLKCATDMMAYLEASYKCLPVTQTDAAAGDCDVKNPTRVMAPPSGFSYLSSYWMRGRGWSDCPLAMSAPAGQRIELYIFEFAALPRYRTDLDLGEEVSWHVGLDGDQGRRTLDYCQVYAIAAEQKTTKELTVCHGAARESHVYSSSTNSMVLQFSEQVVNDRSINFLLKYGVSGCPDLSPPKNAWIRRTRDQATVTCNSTGLTWHLVCKGTSWIGREATNDCEEKSSQEEGLLQGQSFPTYGLLTAVVTGVFIGAVCGFSLLGAVLWCKRRSSRNRSHKECSLQMIQEGLRISGPPTETTEYDGSTTYDPHYHHHHHHHHGFYLGQSRFAQQSPDQFHSGGSFQPPCKVHHRLENGEYGYTHVWEIAGSDGETKHPHLALIGADEQSPDGAALNFSAYAPSTYNGARLMGASPSAQSQSQINSMAKPSVSSFKPQQRQDAGEVCSYQSCSKQLPPNFTFVKLSEGSRAIEDTYLSTSSPQRQKPILDHPSLLQDHVQKMSPVSDRCPAQPAVKEASPEAERCPGNLKDFYESSDCCASELSKSGAGAKKLENHYT